MGPDRTEPECVTIGRGIGDRLRSCHAAGTAHILDDYLLAQDLAQEFYNGRRPHSSLDGTTPDQAYFNPLPLRLAA
jgi:transposase InsO family protein